MKVTANIRVEKATLELSHEELVMLNQLCTYYLSRKDADSWVSIGDFPKDLLSKINNLVGEYVSEQ